MWPWSRIRELEAMLRNSELCRANNAALLDEYRRERDYWREKAEILLDSTLFHRGEVRNHVFSKPKEQAEDPLRRALAGLAHTEIESAKRPAVSRE